MKPFALLLYSLFSLVAAKAQPDTFSTPARIDDVHTVYTYQKSNWDGSHASTIFLYVADTAQLQSFKWSKGDTRATLVTADFDWGRFSVKRFQNHQVTPDGKRQLVATLEVYAHRRVALHLGTSDTMKLDSDHWHSYDFDFASLNFSWRALKNKRDGFSFLIADVAVVNQRPAFVNKGLVQVDFIKEEKVNGKNLLLYKIDGPGLENKGGHIWIDPVTSMMEEYRIALPDEEGFKNGRLRLLKVEKMTPAAWEQFIAAKMKE